MRLKFCPVCGSFEARRLKAREIGVMAKLDAVYRCPAGHLFVGRGRKNRRRYLPFARVISFVPVGGIRPPG